MTALMLAATAAVSALLAVWLLALCRAAARADRAAQAWDAHVADALAVARHDPPARPTAYERWLADEARREAAIRWGLPAEQGDVLVALDRQMRGAR